MINRKKKTAESDERGNVEEPEQAYDVGYGRPPKHTRFEKGKSGNPKGRPKGSNNFSTDVMNVLKAPVKTREGGRIGNLSTQMAGLMRIREKALAGDGKALDQMMQLAARYNNQPIDNSTGNIEAEDQAIMDRMFARMGVVSGANNTLASDSVETLTSELTNADNAAATNSEDETGGAP